MKAIQQFKTIFMEEEKRNNRTEWRNFFLTEMFLDEQYEEDFVIAMHEFLMQQAEVPFSRLPAGLVIELAIVYVLWPNENDYCVVFDETDCYEEEEYDLCKELLAEIWNSQENSMENYLDLQSKASFIRRKSYDEYRTVRFFAINDLWEYKSFNDSIEEYKYTLSMVHWELLADDEKVNRMDIEDIRLEDDITHACEVELFDYLLRKYRFPIEPCAYMYRELELENIENTEYADIYKDLKAHILELHPDMNDYYKCNITAEDYADDLAEMLKQLQEKYEKLGWGKNFTNLYEPCYATEVVDWCEEDAQEVYKIVDSALFQKYKCEPRVISELIISQFSITEAKIFYDIYNKPELYLRDDRIKRLLHDLFSRINIYEMQEEYLMSKEYVYDLDINTYDFWEYFFSVAFEDRGMIIDEKYESPIPGGSLYGDKMTLQTYMRWTYMPSAEWRLRFTNYDKEKGRFGEARKMCFSVNEDIVVTIEFHYHYVRYYVNEKEIILPIWDVDTLFVNAVDDEMFLLLLPITKIEYTDAPEIFDRLMDILPNFVRFPLSSLYIAEMIANDNPYIDGMKNLISRHYIENLKDCYRLDIDTYGNRRLYHFHSKYGCWEDINQEMIGKHYRDTLYGEPDCEGWNMKTFEEKDLTLPYEVETQIHDFSKYKIKEKSEKLYELLKNRHDENVQDDHFLNNNQLILVFGDKDRIHLRQHLLTGIMLNEQMEQEAYSQHRYLSMDVKKIRKYAKEELKWLGWMQLENCIDTFPVAMGVSGYCYAFGITYDKGMKANSFTKLLGKTMCLDDLTHVIEYEIENRSDWDTGK